MLDKSDKRQKKGKTIGRELRDSRMSCNLCEKGHLGLTGGDASQLPIEACSNSRWDGAAEC
jgi:hypothetical protein